MFSACLKCHQRWAGSPNTIFSKSNGIRSLSDTSLPSISILPTEQRISVRPMKRRNPTVEMLHDALNEKAYGKACGQMVDGVNAETIEKQIAQQRARLHANDHTRMLGIMVRHNIPALAVRHATLVWRNMVDAGHVLDVRDMNSIMFLSSSEEDTRRVVETFQTLTLASRPVVPDVKSYHILLAAYARAGLVKETVEVWELMKKKHAGGKERGRCMGRFQHVQFCHKRKVPPTALRLYCSGSWSFRESSRSFQLDGKLSRTMGSRTLDTAIKIFEASGDLQRARDTWAKATAFGVEGDLGHLLTLHEEYGKTYPPSVEERSIVVEALLEGGRRGEAVEVFDEMLRKGLIPKEELVNLVSAARFPSQ
ncbi:hypothetical protein BC829DRAFT_380824 [Chytridium lagenaria]|nr:hypothetical protein BC829DRAFT_380824 [Chytridium lagenaria]